MLILVAVRTRNLTYVHSFVILLLFDKVPSKARTKWDENPFSVQTEMSNFSLILRSNWYFLFGAIVSHLWFISWLVGTESVLVLMKTACRLVMPECMAVWRNVSVCDQFSEMQHWIENFASFRSLLRSWCGSYFGFSHFFSFRLLRVVSTSRSTLVPEKLPARPVVNLISL